MTERIQLRDRSGVPIGDLDINRCEVCDMREILNGEHALDIDTTQELSEGMRMLHVDGTGKVREWVVDEAKDTHSADGHVHTYGATWSMQYDLMASPGGEVWASADVGTHDPTTPALALRAVLDGDPMWEVGDVTLMTSGACSLYDGSRWDYIKKLIDTFGGEVEPRIVADSLGNVTHRYVDWHAHVGTTNVTRRFDYGHDLERVDRTESPGPRYTRIRPRGGSTKTDNDGVDYTERVGIEEIVAEDMAEMDGWRLKSGTTYGNGELRFTLGTDYIEDVSAASDFDWGNHPTKTVIYDVAQVGGVPDVFELFSKAAADTFNHTRPKVTYEAEVEQFEAAGMDVHGVALGDEVHVVDAEFKPVPLRIAARVTEVTRSLIGESDIQLVIGNHLETLGSSFRDLQHATVDKVEAITSGGMLVYVHELLDRVNSEINAIGGYAYFVDGEGTITYDIAVDDPLVGYNSTAGKYAERVTQMKGGTIRFANTKKPSFAGINDWNWTNVITADGYIGLAATIARLEAGYIGDPTSGNYWNLDTGELRMASTLATVDNKSLGNYVDGVADTKVSALNTTLTQAEILNRLTGGYQNQGLYIDNGRLYINASFIATGSLAGFKLTSTALYTGRSLEDNYTNAVALTSADFTRVIGSTSVSGLRFAIGNQFAVDSDGKLYASNADIAGKVTATSGTIGGFTIDAYSISNENLRLFDYGIKFTKDDLDIGRVGSNHIIDRPNKRGLVFDLNYDGTYMMWASLERPTDTTYTMKMCYARPGSFSAVDDTSEDRIVFGVDLDGYNHKAYKLWLDPDSSGAINGVTATVNFVQILTMNSNGTAARWGDAGKFVFKNGMLVDIHYYNS